MKSLEGDIVFDTSVLIEVMGGTDFGVKLVELIYREKIVPHITELNLIETLYVICRKQGFENSLNLINTLVNSGYFNIHSISEIRNIIGECKCKYPISIADCTTLSLAKHLNCPAIFSKFEKEFRNIIEELSKCVGKEIIFLRQ